MSNSPPRDAPNVVISSPITSKQAVNSTDIALDELNNPQQHNDSAATAQDTPKADRKGKGKAVVEVDRPVDEIDNYDLREELEGRDAVQMQSRLGHENVFDDDNEADDSGSVSPGNGAYPPLGDDDLEERRVNEVRVACLLIQTS